MTSDLKDPGKVEGAIPAISSTAGGALGGTAGAFIGGPLGGLIGGALGGLIPSLIDIPVSRRQRQRTEIAFQDIEERLTGRIDEIQQPGDEQFKIISESLITISQTLEARKTEYLKSIAVSAVRYSDYSSYDSILLSRIIRDISAEELTFLLKNFAHTSFNIFSWYDEDDKSEEKLKDLRELRERISQEGGLLILQTEPEAPVANGLLNLGVLMPGKLALGVYKYRISGIAVKLIKLLR